MKVHKKEYIKVNESRIILSYFKYIREEYMIRGEGREQREYFVVAQKGTRRSKCLLVSKRVCVRKIVIALQYLRLVDKVKIKVSEKEIQLEQLKAGLVY